jgi:glycosyltransferase involved in cell wall biosynthesis
MKILVVQDYLRSGGTERQSVLLANEFAHAGHAVQLLTFRPGGVLARTLHSTVSHRALQLFDTRLDWFAPGLGRAAQACRPDIVLCMGRMANCYAGRLQRRLPRAAVVCTLRTGKKLPSLFRRSLSLVRHVVANSRDARDRVLHETSVPPDRVSVIYNSLVFPPGSARPDAEARRATRVEHGASDRTADFLNVAMFLPEKNQRELVEIFAGFSPEIDWQLWLAGDGPARFACERLVAARGIAGRVKFLGWHANPSALYAAGDVAVHASRSESLSNFLIEAQAHGLPAVACTAQGVSECFVPGDTGIAISPGDRHGFRLAALRFAAADAGRRERARIFARQTFDVTRQVDAYLDLFQKISTPAV